MQFCKVFLISCVFQIATSSAAEALPRALRVGVAGHAFDHLGGIANQGATAAASGATVIYATGLGGRGYTGLPTDETLAKERAAVAAYNREAKGKGIELSIGYLCATSIVKLSEFDKNWSAEFRAQFTTQPVEWRQQDRQGRPLASWYGGDYTPACMNNPNWRAYERAMVREQLAAGHDGIFFDNPTVHPEGCYCPHCMQAFGKFYDGRAAKPVGSVALDIEELRALAAAEPEMFLRFRATIAARFLTNMREHARTINPRALITCNNSLNSPGVLYSQCRTYGYSIYEMSKVEDLVVVEDMATQPRTEANGQTIEYGPTYRQLRAISHGKPVVAVTLAGGDYHTPANLMRLAMAEAAAHGASYLSWPTWPESERGRMAASVRPQVDFLRRNESLLNNATPRAEAILFLPIHRWVTTDHCAASEVASALTAANIQYRVVTDDELAAALAAKDRPVLVVESMGVLTADQVDAVDTYRRKGAAVVAADEADWLVNVRAAIGRPAIKVEGPSRVRAIVQDQPGRAIVHLYNLGVQRLSSFEDQVSPVANVLLHLSVPFAAHSVELRTADGSGDDGSLAFKNVGINGNEMVQITVPRLEVNAIIVVEQSWRSSKNLNARE